MHVSETTSEFRGELFDLFNSVTSPAHGTNDPNLRVISFKQFIAIIDEKMVEAYHYGLRQASQSAPVDDPMLM